MSWQRWNSLSLSLTSYVGLGDPAADPTLQGAKELQPCENWPMFYLVILLSFQINWLYNSIMLLGLTFFMRIALQGAKKFELQAKP